MPRPRRVTLLGSALIVPLLAAGEGRTQPPGAGGVASLFGVVPDTREADLDVLARASRTDCRPGALPAGSGATRAIVCATSPVPSPFPASVTYWYEAGLLDRVFRVDALVSPLFGDYETRFRQLESWVSKALGPPARPAVWPQAPRSRQANDSPFGPESVRDDRMAELLAGRYRVISGWAPPGMSVDLWLSGEGGRPALVLAMRQTRRVHQPVDCSGPAVMEALLNLFPPASDAARAAAARRIADCRVSRAAGALSAALDRDQAPQVQAEALRALDALDRAPPETELGRLAGGAPPAVAEAAREILAARARQQAAAAAAAAPAAAPAPAPMTLAERLARPATAPPASSPPPARPTPPVVAAKPASSPAAPAAPAAPPAARVAIREPPPTARRAERAPEVPLAPPPPPKPRGPLPGTPLAIGTSTVAGAALMRNLGLMGGQGLSGVTPQLLLGTTGAVIGFGTSWGLSRFGFRPTIEQAAWFANTTAWGTLAGLTVWSASGSNSLKLQYGSLVMGEAAGMGLGVWSAHRWRWSGPQIALADSFVLGAGLSAFGVGLIRSPNPKVTIADAIATPLVMTAAAIAAHEMNPTANDLRLQLFSGLAAGWSGGLIAAGAYETTLLGSRQSRGGAAVGLGAGYLLGAAAGAFTETETARLGVAGAGLLAGNALGLGLHITVQGFTHDNPPGARFSTADVNGRALSAGVGGLVLGGAAYAYAPYLRPGPSALAMTASGALYGAGTWWLASLAGYRGQPVTEVDDARLRGGLLAGATLGGLGGLVASRWFAPDGADQATAAAATALGISAGVGTARLTTDERGAPDSAGVLIGAGVGFGAGAWAAARTRLRPPDLGAGAAGLGFGALAGALAPSLGDDQWTGGRREQGGALLGLAVGAAGATAGAHLGRATADGVLVPTTAALLGLGMGVGAGLAWPCDDAARECTSRAPRIGAFAGPPLLAASALALEPTLHLARGLGPAAPRLAASGMLFGGAWGLLGAAALDPSGVVAETPWRQRSGGLLFGASSGVASGLVLSRFYDPTSRDLGFTFASSVTGGALGLGIAQLATADAGRFDTLAMLGGSSGGMLAGALLAPRLTLRPPDYGAMLLGASAGALVGALAPSLASDTWMNGRQTHGGELTGVAAGAAGALTLSYLTEARTGQVAVATGGAALGVGIGLGTGLMWPTETTRPARIGATAGTVLGLGVSLAADRRLHLSDGLPDGAGALAGLGGALGAANGVLLAAALDPSGQIGETPPRQRQGGLLVGASAGIAAGLTLAPFYQPDGGDLVFVAGADVGGAALGLGIARLAFAEPGRHDTVATLLGSSGGLLAGAVLAPRLQLRAVDLGAATIGVAYGTLAGTLAPSLGDDRWNANRRAGGGTLVGLAVGGAAGLAAANGTRASSAQVAVPATAGLLGIGVGLGAGLAAPTQSSQPARIGTVAGVVGGVGLGIAGDLALHLDEGLGPRAPAMASLGAAFGIADGLLVATAIDPSGRIAGTPDRQLWGGALAGGSAGLAAGLTLSRFYAPDGGELAFVATADIAGGALGLGISQLAFADGGRHDPIATLLGSSAGLVGGALLAPRLELRPLDLAAATFGAAYGGLVGTLAPSLGDDQWHAGRRTGGGALVGVAAGAAGALAASNGTRASVAQVAVPATAGLFGIGVGLGAGLAAPTNSLQPARIGTVAGVAGGIGFGIFGDLVLHLDDGLGPQAPALGILGGAFGAADGLLVAAALDPSGRIAGTPDRQLRGGVLMGVSAELGAGLLVSKKLLLRPADGFVLAGGKILGGTFGLGAALIARPHAESGRDDTLATLGGSVAGMGAAVLTQAYAPLDGTDATAAGVGAAFGGMLGTLAPTLDEPTFGGLHGRLTTGGLLVGLAGGAMGGAALRHASGAAPGTVGLATLGGVDGLLTGLGIGLLEGDGDGPADRAERIGVVAGASAGLGMGALVWPRLHLDANALWFTTAASAVAGWTGLWLPALGHANIGDVSSTKSGGGLLAGAGVASFGASLLAPALRPDPDLVGNAIALDVLWSGAGAGVGALVSQRDDAPIWGMLSAGTAGLLVGGALHRHIEIDEADEPLLTLAAIEGIWFGGWLPNVVYDVDSIGLRQRLGGLAAGTFGAIGLGAVASGAVEIDAGRAGYAGLGSALGASIGGGLALLSPSFHDRRGYGMMLGGTALGLGVGAAVAPRLADASDAPLSVIAGAGLGLSEALLFAWSGRADQGEQYAGAALLGAGVGASLGLAASATVPSERGSTAPAAAGFAAWGAWMGSFTGSLVKNDAHEVVMGGLIGANVGFLGGYGLLHTGAVEPRDFGWLSLFGALGTVAGGLTTAPFSTRGQPAPLLAGLAAGPAVGMITGALVLPRLRRLAAPSGPQLALADGIARGPMLAGEPEHGQEAASGAPSDRLQSTSDAPPEGSSLWQRVSRLVQVTEWAPLVGALPAPEATGPPPLLFGLTGLWK